ncbi:hypothetical protein DCC79_05805 [bacterium]|nr:hypothetical protein [Chloroflexi bacterium CFX6]RIL11133.1 MAG: hypothetical protein DCC79_05805 [bacterium]
MDSRRMSSDPRAGRPVSSVCIIAPCSTTAIRSPHDVLSTLLTIGSRPTPAGNSSVSALRDAVRRGGVSAMAGLPSGTVTFLFTDIEGSTQRWEHHRAGMARALDAHNARLRTAMAVHGGYVFKTMGDAFCVAFADPAAALEAALDAARAIAAEDWSVFGADFPPLRVRMALHTGPAELQDGDYVGPPVNRVSRLMSAAHGGQVLLSLASQQLVRDALPEGCELRDRGRHRLKDLRHSEHIFQALADGFPDVSMPPDTAEQLDTHAHGDVEPAGLPTACPYRGLAAFREVDAPFFFGREAFTELLLDAVAHGPMAGVVGPSGSGKSSVVFAGLVPRLRAAEGGAGWTVLELRPGARPFHALAGTLVPWYERTDLTETDRLAETGKLAGHLRGGTIAARDVLQRIGDKHAGLDRLLLVVDQFEELYTLCSDDGEQRAFQDLLFSAAFERAGGVPLTLGLTLRADFMGHALAYRPFADAIQRHDVKLGPMTRGELARAVRLPAEIQGRSFEPGLVERIVDDVGEKPGTLPLLEFALTKLWESQEHGWLTHEAYEAIGRVEGAVARHAEATYESLADSDRSMARRVFVQLVRPGEGTEDTRRVATKDELGDGGWGLAQRLASARLVVTDRDGLGRETAEVVHEALIRSWGRLREWMTTDRRFRMWQERLRFNVRQWELAGRDDGALLRGVPLAEAEQWAAERGGEITADEAAFVAAGAALRARHDAEREVQREREHRLQRRVRNLAAGVAAVAMVGLVVSLGFAGTEARTRRASQRLALAAGAQTLLANDLLDPALALAMEATRGDEVPPEAELALADAAYAPGTRLRLAGHAAAVTDVAISPDGRRAASVSWDHTLRLWDLATGEAIRNVEAHVESIEAVAYSPDGRHLLTGSWDNYVGRRETLLVLRDAETGEAIRSLQGHTEIVQVVAFSRDGRRAISGAADRSVRVWDVATGAQLQVLNGHSAWVYGVAFSPDGRYAVSAAGDKAVVVWDLESGAELKRLIGHTNGVYAVAVTPDGKRVVSVSVQPEATLRVWDFETGASLSAFKQPEGIRSLALDASGATALLGLQNGDIVRSDLATGLEIARYTGHTDDVYQVALSPDGRAFASASGDGTVRVWHVESPALEARLECGMPVNAIAFGPDGRGLLVGGRSPRVQWWDVDARELVREMDAHRVEVPDVAVHPDGLTVAIDRLAGPVVRDLRSGGAVRMLDGMRFDSGTNNTAGGPAAGTGLVFSPDGRHVLRTGWSTDARVIDVASGREVLRLAIGAVSHRGAFSPDGSRVVVPATAVGSSMPRTSGTSSRIVSFTASRAIPATSSARPSATTDGWWRRCRGIGRCGCGTSHRGRRRIARSSAPPSTPSRSARTGERWPLAATTARHSCGMSRGGRWCAVILATPLR